MDIPRDSVKTQATRSACDDCYFAIEGEDALEVVELDVGFGRHGECIECVFRLKRWKCEEISEIE